MTQRGSLPPTLSVLPSRAGVIFDIKSRNPDRVVVRDGQVLVTFTLAVEDVESLILGRAVRSLRVASKP